MGPPKNWTLHDIRRTRALEACEAGFCGDMTAKRILVHVTAELRTGRIALSVQR